jgi:iduronate 2-sulfatase
MDELKIVKKMRNNYLLRVLPVFMVFWAMTAKGQNRPNVLFVIADDLRNELHCFGKTHMKTPHIDDLAKAGVIFNRAYCQYPVCAPSRASFLMGKRPDFTGVWDNKTSFRTQNPNWVTLPQLFKNNGYETVSIGKVYHRGTVNTDIAENMDDSASWTKSYFFLPPAAGRVGEGRTLTTGSTKSWCKWLAADGSDEDQPDGLTAQQAVRFLDSVGEMPFFLAVGFQKPHDPFIAPRKYFDLYPLESIQLNAFDTLLFNDKMDNLRLAGGTNGMYRDFKAFNDKDRKEFLRAYYAGVSFMDAQLGKVLNKLKEKELDKNTIIIFIGDHGYHLGEWHWWNKNTLFEPATNAPMIWATPQYAKGKICSRVVEFLDIYPTLTDLCGLENKQTLDGISLKPLLSNPGAAWNKPAFTYIKRGEGVLGRRIRTEQFSYIEWNEGERGVELYDHTVDSTEKNNLAKQKDYKAIIEKLSKTLRKSYQ